LSPISRGDSTIWAASRMVGFLSYFVQKQVSVRIKSVHLPHRGYFLRENNERIPLYIDLNGKK